jgi:hypothetical protein
MLLAQRLCRHLATLALGLVALAAPAKAFAQDDTKAAGQAESGFALEASLGARYGVIATGGVGTTGAEFGNGLQTGLFAGYKSGRIVIGVGLEFTNTSASATTTVTVPPLGSATTTTSGSDSNFLIGPEFQFALLRSPDSRVELIADLSLHFGHEFQTVSVSPPPPPNNTPTDSNFLLSYAIAPGVRFWAHPHLALQAVAGFGGDAFFDLPVNNDPTNNHSEHGIFASFGALGVF